MTCKYTEIGFCEGELPADHLFYQFPKLQDVKVLSEHYRK